MAVFRPNNEGNVCKLNFNDQFFYELPLHEDENKRIVSISNEKIAVLKGVDDKADDAFDKVYNIMLDGIDEILGEGAGADIMSLFEKPSLFDIADVIRYITEEYKSTYEERLKKHKVDGMLPEPNGTGTHPASKRGRR